MKKITFKVGYEEEKIKAIRVSLKEKNKDLEQELINFLDALYKKNVPKVLKKYIENSIEIESKDNEKIEEQNNNNFEEEKKSFANNGIL